jgi:hypothetical protein
MYRLLTSFGKFLFTQRSQWKTLQRLRIPGGRCVHIFWIKFKALFEMEWVDI